MTSHHDFFGASIVEAVYCGCLPLLPARLSYPELLPPEQRTLCFCRDLPDLVDRLKAAIEGASWPDMAQLQSAVARFDWRVLGAVYDAYLEVLCPQRRASSR